MAARARTGARDAVHEAARTSAVAARMPARRRERTAMLDPPLGTRDARDAHSAYPLRLRSKRGRSDLLAVCGDGFLVELDAESGKVGDGHEPVRVDPRGLREHRV